MPLMLRRSNDQSNNNLDMKLSFVRIKVNSKKQMLRLLMKMRKTNYLSLHVSLAFNQLRIVSLIVVL